MKNKLLLFLCLLCIAGIKAQNTCATAYTTNTNANWNGLDSFDVSERWHKFNGENSAFKIKLYVKDYSSGNYTIGLYENNCSTLPIPLYTTTVNGDSISIVTETLQALNSYVIYLRNSIAPSYEVFDLYIYSGVSANIPLTGCTSSSCGFPTNCNEYVCNGSFECITAPITADGQINNASNWTGANATTPDLFTSQTGLSLPAFGVPCNGFGDQPANNSTNSYAGIILYAIGGAFNEYLQTKLTAPLVANKSYLISFYVSTADRSTRQANTIGIYLTNSQINIGGFNVLPNVPTATVTNNALLNDFNNWQLITFCYKPTVSGQQFLTIGSPVGAQSSIASGPNSTSCSQVAPANFPIISYLYIDDVSVQLLDVNTASYVACPNTNVNLQGLTCIPNSTYSVNWTPSGGLNNSTIQNPTANVATTTIYNTNLVVTSSNLQTCSATSQSTVFVLPTNSINISASSTTFCPNQTITLTATGSSISYTWLPGNAVSNSILVTPSVTATYTVIGINASGCIGQSTIQISPAIPSNYTFTAIASPAVICVNLNQSSTLTANSNNASTTYSWMPGNFVGSIQTVTPAVTTIFTLNAGINGCVLTKTVTVAVQSACCTQTTPVYAGTSFTTSTTYTSPLVFNADVTINPGISLTLSNTEYLFAPGVKIIVSPGASLNLRGSHLYACGTAMWQGVVVQNNGRVTTNLSGAGNQNHCLVEDAVEAINVTSNTTSTVTTILNLVNTTFNKNYIGVKVDDFQSNATTYPFAINNCVFTSRNFTFTPTTWPKTTTASPDLRFAASATTGIAPPYNLQGAAIVVLKTPHANKTAYAGIALNNVGITSGGYKGIEIGLNSVAGAFNLFDALMYGITGVNSNISSINNVYQNTQRVYICPRCYYDGGSAIKSYITTNLNARLNLTAVGTNSTNYSLGNRFWNCHKAVEADYVYNIDCKYATFRSTQTFTTPPGSLLLPGNYGIINNTNRFEHNISYNKFNNINSAVIINVSPNSYTFAGTTSSGILANNLFINFNYFGAQLTNGTALGTAFLNNAVYLSSTSTTGWLNIAGLGLSVSNNEINRAYRGVYVSAFAYPSQVLSNTVSLVNDNYLAVTQRGISAGNTSNLVIATNKLNAVNSLCKKTLHRTVINNFEYFMKTKVLIKPLISLSFSEF